MKTEISPGRQAALLELLQFLQAQHYRFITVTPATHARVLSWRQHEGATLAEAFGWSMPFSRSLLPPERMQYWLHNEVLLEAGRSLVSTVRVSSLEEKLFLHSPYPTVQGNDVFFGPDTYRFVRFLSGHIGSWTHMEGCRIADIGCGSGAGGIMLASQCHHPQLTLSDINHAALSCARLNAAHNQQSADIRFSDLLTALPGEFDLIVANPPYLNDGMERSYRHGGGRWGAELSLKLVHESCRRLAPGGRLLLYTGSAIENGRDAFREAVMKMLDENFEHEYEEIDVDVFGEELERDAYSTVDRIAVAGLVVVRK
ncbi:MAG TPA: class I SAM-dependent methyltransferase [Moraxellaceae bacterium]